MGKVRRIDFYPEDFWGGVATEFTAEQIGVYWMVCTRIYSIGGPVQDDAARIAKWFDKGHHRSIRAALDALIQAGKLFQCDADGDRNGTGYLFQSRCDTMLKEASKRIDTYRDNGSQPKKKRNEINAADEASAFPVASGSASPSPPSLPPSTTLPPISPKGDGMPPSLFPDDKEPKNTEARRPAPAKAEKEPDHERFQEFWDVWRGGAPNDSRGMATRAFSRAVKHGADPEKIIAGAKADKADLIARSKWGQFVKQAATWLNNRCWEDALSKTLTDRIKAARSFRPGEVVPPDMRGNPQDWPAEFIQGQEWIMGHKGRIVPQHMRQPPAGTPEFKVYGTWWEEARGMAFRW